MSGLTSRSDLVTAVDLDDTGWLMDADTGRPVPAQGLRDYFAERLAPPHWATDIVVYVHGWQTSPQSAVRSAARLTSLAQERFRAQTQLYPQLAAHGFEPWTVVVRWPSASLPGLSGYRRIRDRAHAMGSRTGTGHAAHVIGRLLGYLDAERPDPAGAATLANREGQYLHLAGHSFGCRFLCEAVLWAADASLAPTLSWSAASRDRTRPFTVDSVLLFQMAAPRDAFATLFGDLARFSGDRVAPVRGPVVATYSRHDRATGFWHLRAEGKPGVGHSGIDPSTTPVFETPLHPTSEPYALSSLDHGFVSIDATGFYTRNRHLNPAGAHSAHLCPESAHLLVSLADLARQEH